MYSASVYDWGAVLDFHATVLTEIEHGNRKWGDSFIDIEAKVLHQARSAAAISSVYSQSSNSSSSMSRARVLFYKPYQSGKCNKAKEHSGFVSGKKCTVGHFCAACFIVGHFCAACFIVDKAQRNHPESDPEGKYYGRSIKDIRDSKLRIDYMSVPY